MQSHAMSSQERKRSRKKEKAYKSGYSGSPRMSSCKKDRLSQSMASRPVIMETPMPVYVPNPPSVARTRVAVDGRKCLCHSNKVA